MILVQDVASKYLLVIGKRSALEVTRLVHKHVLPALGNRPVDSVSIADAYAMHRKLIRTRTQANRALSALSGILSHAELLGLRPLGSNPCRYVKRYRENKRNRYLKSEEITRLSNTLSEYEVLDLQVFVFIRMLMYTGARPSELQRARWNDIKGACISLREHKTDASGGVRRIFLPPQALQGLNMLQKKDNKGLVFQSIRYERVRRVWYSICKKADLKDVHIYDLRHHFASCALKSGLSLPQIGGLLGHVSHNTTMRYAHLMEDDARKSANLTATVVSDMIVGV